MFTMMMIKMRELYWRRKCETSDNEPIFRASCFH